MKRLIAIAVMALCALAASFALQARESFQSSIVTQPAPHPSLYSFSDVYRLTVGGPVLSFQGPAAEMPMRVAVTQGAPAEQQFSISAVPQPGRWTLLMAGLLLAAWVAWRRMDFTI